VNLPEPVAEAIRPLLERLPLEKTMTALLVKTPAHSEFLNLVEEIVKLPAIGVSSPLASGLWLYVDNLRTSHRISQKLEDETGSFWHGIMHRREGDWDNSKYWFSKAAGHPVLTQISGYDSHKFVDDVEARHSESPTELIDLQRKEWCALFEWCANNQVQ